MTRQEAEKVVAELLGDRSPEELSKAVGEWARSRENIEDCFCASDPDGRCWYHTDEAQQKVQRVASFIEDLFPDFDADADTRRKE